MQMIQNTNLTHSISSSDELFGSLIFFTIVYVLVLISGLFGNFAVLFVIFKNKDLKHFTNYFFANLSAADVFVLIFCIPTALHDIWARDQWYMGKLFCLTNQYIESCATSISSLTILAISFERFVAICKPFKVHEIFNKTSTLMTIIAIWTIALLFSLPFYIFVVYDSSFNPTDSFNGTSNLLTICHLDADTNFARAFVTWFIIFLIFIPFFILIYIYARIILELIRHRTVRVMRINKTQTSIDLDEQKSHSFLVYKSFEQKRSNSVIICVVTVAFFICQFPVRIIQLINMYIRVQNENMMSEIAWIWLWKLSKLLFFLNFTANPIIYNILSTKFRRSCRRLLQIPHPSSVETDSLRKTSVTSYLYSSLYKNRHRTSHTYSYQPKFSTIRSSFDSENRDLVTLANNEDVFIPTFQVVNEEDDENIVQ